MHNWTMKKRRRATCSQCSSTVTDIAAPIFDQTVYAAQPQDDKRNDHNYQSMRSWGTLNRMLVDQNWYVHSSSGKSSCVSLSFPCQVFHTVPSHPPFPGFLSFPSLGRCQVQSRRVEKERQVGWLQHLDRSGFHFSSHHSPSSPWAYHIRDWEAQRVSCLFGRRIESVNDFQQGRALPPGCQGRLRWTFCYVLPSGPHHWQPLCAAVRKAALSQKRLQLPLYLLISLLYRPSTLYLQEAAAINNCTGRKPTGKEHDPPGKFEPASLLLSSFSLPHTAFTFLPLHPPPQRNVSLFSCANEHALFWSIKSFLSSGV